METKDFVWTWNPGNWYSPGSVGNELDARLYFWNQNQASILLGLQEDINQGWKPISEVGPSAFKIRTYTKKESSIGFGNVFFWFITFGLAFLVDLFSGMTTDRTYYEPIEFRVHMMKN